MDGQWHAPARSARSQAAQSQALGRSRNGTAPGEAWLRVPVTLQLGLRPELAPPCRAC